MSLKKRLHKGDAKGKDCDINAQGETPSACLALTTVTAAVRQRSLEWQGSLKKYCVNKRKIALHFTASL